MTIHRPVNSTLITFPAVFHIRRCVFGQFWIYHCVYRQLPRNLQTVVCLQKMAEGEAAQIFASLDDDDLTKLLDGKDSEHQKGHFCIEEGAK